MDREWTGCDWNWTSSIGEQHSATVTTSSDDLDRHLKVSWVNQEEFRRAENNKGGVAEPLYLESFVDAITVRFRRRTFWCNPGVRDSNY